MATEDINLPANKKARILSLYFLNDVLLVFNTRIMREKRERERENEKEQERNIFMIVLPFGQLIKCFLSARLC